MWKTLQSSWYIVNNFLGILYIRCEKRTEIIEKTFMNIQGERKERTEQSEHTGITDTAQASCEI